eukprot:CAMPEP_0170527366 /NCGR_PEP_ID=MMETSP0209-20121228/12848_1 /TAXON_ID=665100 ORGANISM="Litonotus pictus, Strain P1" /NCGR_SAMPLE_ID=MMETSP0209 /ASSEMBLY_ACC=CAM_ASM_000301 /LENGTH=521 /DNA_ID=CAMNT_0010817849 /DNA_START=974 /DNA_END=2539 /DNA_ORIENTATION=-
MTKWILCLENKKEREDLVDSLLDRKMSLISNDEKKSRKVSFEAERLERELEKANSLVNKISEMRRKRLYVNVGDGYWDLLSDWSQCSLKCGGGFSLQQWMCVPPSNPQGKHCEGVAVLKKHCNNKPCPGVYLNKDSIGDMESDEHTEKPILKVQPFLSRPQRYERYRILEKDVFLLREKLDDNNKIVSSDRVPVRLVINKNTVSAYQNETLQSAIFTLSLKKIKVIIHSSDSCCLKFSENTQYICGGFSDPCGSVANPIFRKAILQYVNEFSSLYKQQDKQTFQEKPQQAESDIVGMDIVQNREDLLEKKLHDKEEQSLTLKQTSLEKNISRMVKREYNIEHIIEEEEKQKAKKKTELLMSAIKKAKQKKDCLEKIFTTKKEEVEKEYKKAQKLNSLVQIKDLGLEEVRLQREKFKQRIMQIRKRASRKYTKLEKEMTVIRNEMTDDLLSAKHRGNKKECMSRRREEKSRVEYCDKTQMTDPTQNFYCKTEEEFCDYCCQYEFGAFYMKDEADCLKACNAE